MLRIEFKYAGELFSLGRDLEIYRAVSWDNGAPRWASVAGSSRVAMDALIAKVWELTEELEKLKKEVE